MKIKDLGQVFTPKTIVKDILDKAGYKGEEILKKHVIDNSCGDGAFLTEIISRYIKAFKKRYKTLNGVNKDIEEYIHGIEVDKDIYNECIKNLNLEMSKYKIKNIKFDIIHGDALKTSKFDKKMDYVLGNPPYVRVHNLKHQYKSVKEYSFGDGGMTDLYIVFYEIGLKMLNDTGVLCYITPNSFYNSLAGSKLREYIREKQNMEMLIDLGHYQPFSVSTYTTICKICKGQTFEKCKYYKYNSETEKPQFITNIKYKDLYVDNNIVLSSNNRRYLKYLNYELKSKLDVEVKNGFATLNDKIFIQDEFEIEHHLIDVIKASNGQWKKCLYPYDKEGNLIPFQKLEEDVQEYFKRNKKDLVKEEKGDSEWYAFGRTQAIKDVKLNKIAINTCIKDIKSIKLNIVEAGKGVYSGLYMITNIPFETIKQKICSEDFIEYLRVLNKCKSGGYYTFSSKDLSKYINASLDEDKTMENKEFLEIIKKSFYKYLETGSNSNEKLRILHGAIAKDLKARLGKQYKIHSLGYGNDKEVNMVGSYMTKKVDIAIQKGHEIIAGIALKFIMRNYSQNSNNYFENMLGETANIRSAGKPYFQIFIIPSKVPYFKDGRQIEKYGRDNCS